ncbi:hypothetical protein OIU78_026087 [Salix suchowensis]|nr:hypothetical protein OIU78_026087 [Salix suchowensis]
MKGLVPDLLIIKNYIIKLRIIAASGLSASIVAKS